MEIKPIKRSEHIILLSKDHHTSLLFCWKIRQGLKMDAEMERIKKYVQYFWRYHMQPHFEEEEEILFAPLKDEKVQKAIDEHGQIKTQINTLLNRSEMEAGSGLALLADMVDKHVRYEERELFPHLEKTLSHEQLETIGKQLHLRKPSTLKDDFKDEFWIQKQNS